MTQRERDRLVVLRKTEKKLITQRQAAQQLERSERQIHRLLRRLKQVGDGAVIHGLRGRPSAWKRSQKEREKIVRILSQKCIEGLGRRWPASI